MKVLVVGGGGREHAIAEAIARSPKKPEIYAVMAKQNPGIARLCKDFLLEKETNIKEVVEYATSNTIDVAIIGPEAPLSVGLANSLEAGGIPVAGPNKEVARIEFDKAWARDFMRDNDIPGCPEYRVFSSDEGLREFIEKLQDVAVKPAGLTGGKGVKIMGDQLTDINEACEYAKELLENDKVVIEENLKGEEFTLQAFVDGENLAFAPCVQDHKRAFENDLGPNTGGMGSYSDVDVLLPFMLAEDLWAGQEIMKQTVGALCGATGIGYKGILYGQFILTKDGPKVVEFNARFGDPEAMNVLPLLETDMVDVIEAIAHGKLACLEIKFSKKATVCKYIVPAGYPDNPDADKEIIFGDIGEAILFYSSVYERDGKIYTTSSRSAAVVGVADSIAGAERIAQEGIENIIGDLHSRSDIGTEALIAKKVNHMKEIRGY